MAQGAPHLAQEGERCAPDLNLPGISPKIYRKFKCVKKQDLSIITVTSPPSRLPGWRQRSTHYGLSHAPSPGPAPQGRDPGRAEMKGGQTFSLTHASRVASTALHPGKRGGDVEGRNEGWANVFSDHALHPGKRGGDVGMNVHSSKRQLVGSTYVYKTRSLNSVPFGSQLSGASGRSAPRMRRRKRRRRCSG